MEKNYNILGINKKANEKEIKIAFKKLALKYHPDKNGDINKFNEINNAYNILLKQKNNEIFSFQEFLQYFQIILKDITNNKKKLTEILTG